MTDTTSPLTKEYPKQDWVRGLSKRDRKEYEKVRAADIERDTEGILGVLASIPGFDAVPEQALREGVAWIAARNRDAYEEGVQVGRDANEEDLQRENDELRRYKYHAQEAVAS